MLRVRAWARKTGVTAPGVLASASVCGFVLVYVLTVRTIPGRRFGDASLRGALVTNSGVVEAVDAVLGVVSMATLLGGVASVALIALARLHRLEGLAAVGVLVAANGSTWLLKSHLLSRPDLGLREISPATHNSLPSGHTTAVFSVVVAVLMVAPERARHLVAIAGGAGAVVTALATMSAGWHRAGDSIAAFLVVGSWSGLAGLVVAMSGDHDPSRDSAPPAGDRSRRRRPLVAMTVGSAGVGGCLAVGLVLIRPLRTSTIGELTAFVAGGVLIIVTAVAVLMGELRMLERADRRPRPEDDGPRRQ